LKQQAAGGHALAPISNPQWLGFLLLCFRGYDVNGVVLCMKSTPKRIGGMACKVVTAIALVVFAFTPVTIGNGMLVMTVSILVFLIAASLANYFSR